MRIFFFGDSITQGFYDPQGGWAQQLINEYHARTLVYELEGNGQYIEAFNLGVSGDTVEGVTERIDAEIMARHIYDDEDVIVLAVGVNDAILRQNIAVNEEYDFEAKVEKLVDKALSHTNRLLLVGLTPVDETLTNPLKSSRSGKQYKNNRIDLFEDIIKQVAGRKKIACVPIYDILRAELNKGTKLHADGLHPNDQGHDLIAELVRPKLRELTI